MIALFDLPVSNSSERKQYNLFRKLLLHSGYRHFQHSVYIKLLRNISNGAGKCGCWIVKRR